jgi:hypothetical protein
LEYSNNTGGRVVANRDYYPSASGIQTNATTPFDGTVGTGWGTLARRPTTCTPGVAYFATDQGSWNTSTSNPYGVQQNGADGVLYKCTATNTWTLYYTPYTYPHPLQGAVSAPTNVTLPVITGTTTEGQTLTGSTGTWTGVPSPTFDRQWERCDSGGINCSDIGGATTATYLLVSGDVGHTIREQVIATNSEGSDTADSLQTAVIAANGATPTPTPTPSPSPPQHLEIPPP